MSVKIVSVNMKSLGKRERSAPMWKMQLYLLSLFFAFSAKGQGIHDESLIATETAQGSVFTANPSAIFQDKLWVTYLQSQSTDTSQAVANNNGVTDQRDYKIKTTKHELGTIFPLGDGSDFGLTMKYLKKSLEAKTEGQSRVFEESGSEQGVTAKFVTDLVPNLRAGFAYTVENQSHDILGQFSISESDRTQYKGYLTGYRLGLFYHLPDRGVGFGYYPGLRGKVKVQGEEKIAAERGMMAVDGFYLSQGVRYGVVYKKWSYKLDDRSLPYQSRVDERSMSLRGLDFSQFIFDKEALLLGMDYPLTPESFFVLSLGHIQSVFLFDGTVIPGEVEASESKLSSILARIGATYEKNEFKLGLYYSHYGRSISSFRDSRGWMSANQYDKYKSTENVLSFSLSFVR